MNDVYRLADTMIQQQVGGKMKAIRLKQNITQRSLAESAEVSLSTVKKIENGEIGSFASLLRILRVLGRLDALQPLIEEEPLSPNEYYEMMQAARKKTRRRAVCRVNTGKKEASTW